MNWDVIQGKWKQIKGEVRQQWADLTDDEVEMIQGSRDKLAGKLQERYGWSREEAEREIDQWASRPRV